MPGDIDYEICQTALELLSDLCSRGEVQNDHCLDFIYYFRDLARPRHTDSGEEEPVRCMSTSQPACHLGDSLLIGVAYS